MLEHLRSIISSAWTAVVMIITMMNAVYRVFPSLLETPLQTRLEPPLKTVLKAHFRPPSFKTSLHTMNNTDDVGDPGLSEMEGEDDSCSWGTIRALHDEGSVPTMSGKGQRGGQAHGLLGCRQVAARPLHLQQV